jgi:hypothetical protein
MTPDRIFYPLAALVAAGLIALATAYPQGQGDRSTGAMGHAPDLLNSAMARLHRVAPAANRPAGESRPANADPLK